MMIHPTAETNGAIIGSGTRVWQYCIILPGAEIGPDCNICAHVFIEGGARVGARVTIKCGVQLWDGIHLSDDVFIGPNATFTNDPFPRSRKWPAHFPTTIVEQSASIGANSTILPGLTIGRGAMVGAGAVVTRNVSPQSLVVGNPARHIGWICVCGKPLKLDLECGCGRRYNLTAESIISPLSQSFGE